MKKHQKGEYAKDVYIAFVTDKKHKRHLSDIFEAIKNREKNIRLFISHSVELTEKIIF